MEKIIQYATKSSFYDGRFDNTGWQAPGMGYIVCTENGKLIAIDGGERFDGEEFFELLRRYGDERTIEVDTWILTHPHGDHYHALLDICEKPQLLNQIKINRIICNFPKNSRLCPQSELANLEFIRSASGAEIYVPTTNEKMTVDGMELHFLYSPDDVSFLTNVNQLSLVFTVQGKNKKAMFTGDTYRRNLRFLMWRYDNNLKCDIIQLPHHGFCDTGLHDFYRKVDASIVLLPTSIAGYRCFHTPELCVPLYGDQHEANLWAEKRAEKVYKSFDGTAEIML